MSAGRPTITDVARRAGVSKATVSAVLNDRDSVADATRLRVRSVIEEMNYRPRYAGGHPRRARRNALGLVLKELDNPYYAEIAAGMREAAWERGYALFMTSSEGQSDAEGEAIDALRLNGVSGLVATPVTHTEGDTDLSHLFELKRSNFPFVLLERIRGLHAPVVDVDNVEASRAATEFLMQGGHERIVHFGGPAYSLHSAERADGMRRAYSRSSHVFPEGAIIPAGPHLVDGYRVGLEYFGELRDSPDRPTAVTCYNDLVALGLHRALAELGLSVPGDVSIVGFDDLDILAYTGIALTTMRVPREKMGRRSIEMLVDRVESPTLLPPESVLFEAGLVVRGTTRCLR